VETLISLLDILAWPSLVLILMLMFKGELRTLILRLRSAQIDGRVFQFGETDLDRGVAPKAPKKPKATKKKPSEAPKLDKPATLYWLANDLMWAQDMLFRGAPKDRVLAGIKHAKQYAQALGLEGSYADTELARLIGALETPPGAPPTPLFTPQIPQLANALELVKRDIAARMENKEPGFTKLRAL
jgi:hypothetical protein